MAEIALSDTLLPDRLVLHTNSPGGKSVVSTNDGIVSTNDGIVSTNDSRYEFTCEVV